MDMDVSEPFLWLGARTSCGGTCPVGRILLGLSGTLLPKIPVEEIISKFNYANEMRTGTVLHRFTSVGIWLLGACLPVEGYAQEFSLHDAILIAQENSLDAKVAKFSFLASYWTYRSFKAELLPSVNLSGGLMNFNRSLVETRNYEDGRLAYVSNNTLSNSLTLSVDQQIAATGGRVSLQSYLYRLDQFSYKEHTYNSQPLRISYTQPLRSFNSLKWEKKTAPLEYEIAQKSYLAAMQEIAIKVTSLFFNVLSAQSVYRQSQDTQTERERLYVLAQQRLELGTTTKSEVLQMELSLLNARVSAGRERITLDDAMYNLFSYLRVTDYENACLIPPSNIPDLVVDVNDVLQKAINNSSHTREQRLNMLKASKNLAQAKSSRGLQVTLSGELGFMQSDKDFLGAYSHLRDNEVVGLTLRLPIFDWGLGKGRVRMAQAQMEVVKTQQELAHQDYVQELRKKVMQFNAQPVQCQDAQRAQEIAEERYDIMRKRYETGTVTVTDLNTAQNEMTSARSQYIYQLKSFWTDYFGLQKATLYDWRNNRDVMVDIDNIIKE